MSLINLVGINIGKNSYFLSIMDKLTGEIILNPTRFENNIEGFNFLIQHLNTFLKDEILIEMEDTSHYYFTLLQHLLSKKFLVALINSKITVLYHKLNGKITKNDKFDTLNI